jgi:hypothetical protein
MKPKSFAVEIIGTDVELTSMMVDLVRAYLEDGPPKQRANYNLLTRELSVFCVAETEAEAAESAESVRKGLNSISDTVFVVKGTTAFKEAGPEDQEELAALLATFAKNAQNAPTNTKHSMTIRLIPVENKKENGT